MKKIIYGIVVALPIILMTGCGSETVKSDTFGVEVTLPGNGWEKTADNGESFVIAKDKDMVNYSVNDLPEGYSLAKTEDELKNTLGKDVMAVSKILDFEYTENEDGSNKNLFYVQVLKIDSTKTTMINSFKIQNNKLVTANATLTNARDSKIKEISEVVKGL